MMDQQYVWLLALLALVATATWLWRVIAVRGVG